MATSGTSQKPDQSSRLLVFAGVVLVGLLYLAMLLCVLVAVAIAVGAVWGAITLSREMHRLNPRVVILVALVVIGAILGCIAILKGVITSFQRARRFEPAVLIEMGSERDLCHFIAPLCSKVGTRIPDAVILHSEPTFFVTQGKLQLFNGVANGRILALGAPLLAALTKNELRAVLAHEFAHFSGNDTLYSSVVAPAFMGAATAFQELHEAKDESESLTQSLPLYLPLAVLWMSLTGFSRIDARLSRARELRADDVAISVCGGRPCKVGLMKAAGVSCAFYDDSADQIVRNVAGGADNRLAAFRTALPHLNDIANAHFRTALSAPENPYDSHPSLRRRLDRTPDTPDTYADTGSAASLLRGLVHYESTLSGCCEKMAMLARMNA